MITSCDAFFAVAVLLLLHATSPAASMESCQADNMGSQAVADMFQSLLSEVTKLRSETAELRELVEKAAKDDGQDNTPPPVSAVRVGASLSVFIAVIYYLVNRQYRRLEAEANGKDSSAHELVAYYLGNWFSMSPGIAKPVSLAIGTLVLIVFGSALLLISGEEAGESIWQAWTFVADPGTHADMQGGFQRFVGLIISIGGMLVFALVVGIVAESISESIDGLRHGKTRVIESNHTVLLNWSDKTLPVINELCEANASEGGGVIVLLAERDKLEMESDIADAGLDMRGTRVVVRSGSTWNIADLRKISAATAKVIIVVADTTGEADEADAKALRVVLSLMGMRSQVSVNFSHIVVEVQDADNRELVHLVGQDIVETVVAHDIMGRLMIQCALQPGLSHVLQELLSFQGCEIYDKEWPELVGRTFDEVTFAFSEAITVGIFNEEKGAPVLNPPGWTVIEPGDKILVVAEDDDAYKPDREPVIEAVSPERVDYVEKERGPQKLLFCGWRRDMDDMIMELDTYVKPGSELWLLSSVPIQERQDRLLDGGLDSRELKNLKLCHEEGNTVLKRHLARLKLEDFDSIIILADESLETDMQTADSRSLATLLLLRQQVKNVQHIRWRSDEDISSMMLSEVLDPRTRSLINLASISNYVMSNDLISSALAQVSENRHMNKIIGEILSADGNECYMKDARIYAAEDEELSFWQVTARARGLQHVVLGYRLFESNEVAPTLNPKERDVKRKWHENDVIVVLGED